MNQFDSSQRCDLSGGEALQASDSPTHDLPFLRLVPKSHTELIDMVQRQLKHCPDLKLTGLAGMINSDFVCPPRWTDQSKSFSPSKKLKSLVEEIKYAGVNIEPIVVRPCESNVHAQFPQARFEALTGVKRLQVAQNLKSEVFVVVVEADDQLAARMISLGRDMCPYEYGCLCKCLLKAGVFKNQSELAIAIARQGSEISRELKLAKLHTVILDVFPSVEMLQALDGPALHDAWKKDEAGIRERAKAAMAQKGQLSRLQILELLLSENPTLANEEPGDPEHHVVRDGITYFGVKRTSKGKVSVKAARNNVPVEGVGVLIELFNQLLDGPYGQLFNPG